MNRGNRIARSTGLAAFAAMLLLIRFGDQIRPITSTLANPVAAPVSPSPLNDGEIRRIDVGAGPIFSVAISPDGKRLATGGQDRTVRIWDAASGKELYRMSGHNSAVTCVAFSPDGKQLGSAGGLGSGGLILWDPSTGRSAGRLEAYNAFFSSLAFSADSRSLVGSGTEPYGSACMVWWDATRRRLLKNLDHWPVVFRDPAGTGPVAISPDGTTLLISHYTIGLWGVKKRRETARFDHRGLRKPWLIRTGVFTHAGTQIFAGGLHGQLGLWDVTSGDPVLSLPGHQDDVCQVAISNDDTRAVSCGRDGTVHLWDIKTGKSLRAFQGHRGAVWSVAIASSNSIAASAGEDGTIRIWSLQ